MLDVYMAFARLRLEGSDDAVESTSPGSTLHRSIPSLWLRGQRNDGRLDKCWGRILAVILQSFKPPNVVKTHASHSFRIFVKETLTARKQHAPWQFLGRIVEPGPHNVLKNAE